MKSWLKETVAVLLTLTLVLGSGLPVAASPLPDTVGHWAEQEVRQLVALGAIRGYPDGTYRPEQSITRAEFSSVVWGALDLEEVGGTTFLDIRGHWGQGRIEALIREGIIDTDVYGSDYGPDVPISREEIAMMTSRTLSDRGEPEDIPFIDAGGVRSGFDVYVARAYHAGIIRGYPDNTFRPGGSATRAEAAVMMLRTLVVDKIKDRGTGSTSASGEYALYASLGDREEVMVRVIAEDELTGQPLGDIDVELIVTDSTLELFLQDPNREYLPQVLVFDLDALDAYADRRLAGGGGEIGKPTLSIAVGLLAVGVQGYGLATFILGGIAIMTGVAPVLTVGAVLTMFAVSLAGNALYAVSEHLRRDRGIAYPTTFYVFDAADSDHATVVSVPAGATGEEIDRAIRDVTGNVDVVISIPTEHPAGAYRNPDGSPKIYYVHPVEEAVARQYTVTVSADQGGTVAGGGTFSHGEEVTVVATPRPGYSFRGWWADGDPSKITGSTAYTFTATSDRTLNAVFDVTVDAPASEPADVSWISAGRGHSLALNPDGRVWAWGNNNQGQLGDGTQGMSAPGLSGTENRHEPVRVLDLTDVVSIGAGKMHSLALKSDGMVWAWGWNDFGQLGDGTRGVFGNRNRSEPVRVLGLTDVVAIHAGGGHSLALTSGGRVWAWGSNSSGQLGDGTTRSRNEPVHVSGLIDVVAISAGSGHSLALTSGGRVWAWGYNFSGQLGDGTITSRNEPMHVSGLTDVVAIGCGSSHSLALTSGGRVWAWGNNHDGQLGVGRTLNRREPVHVSGLTDVVAISGGASHSLALTAGGTVWAWGYNWSGELGDGTITSRNEPVQVRGLILLLP